MKKKRQNAKRRRTTEPSREPQNPEPSKASEETTETTETTALEFDEDMVEHLRVQTSLLEEREVSREETIEMLRRIMRQRSMAEESRRDYVVRFLKEKEENPP